VASEDIAEFGVRHSETWSLPIVARKGAFRQPSAEIAGAYGEAVRKSVALTRELEFHQQAHQEAERALAERLEWVAKVEAERDARTEWAKKLEAELEARTEWARKTEAALDERTQWALSLKQEKERALADFQRLAADAESARQHIEALQKDLAEARAARTQLEATFWTRTGRKLGAV
jgi:DNA repair exonuclease SbcCD ATPase subunit